MTSLSFKKPFVILDLETSGMDPKKDSIIEVAMVRFEDGKEVARLDELISVDFPLPKIIQVITGITDKDIRENGKPHAEVMAEVKKMAAGAYLVAHNAPFDIGFLKNNGLPIEDSLGIIDTIPLAQILFPQMASFSLESLCDDLRVKHVHKHRAMGDVEATVGLFKHLWMEANKLPKATIQEIQMHLKKSVWEGGVLFEEAHGKAGASAPVPANTDLSESVVPRPLGVDEILGDQGALSQNWDDYEPREQQLTMSNAVLSAFQEGYHLICEAPTGVGKSLAYLIPAAYQAISNKQKVVISTNTITLQEQLMEKDIPLLKTLYQKATGSSGPRVAMLKGRSHYLCLRRLAEFKRRPRFNQNEVILLTKILVWQTKTTTGDSAEIHLNREELPIWDFELCSDKKFCSKQKCKAFGDCYLPKARELAEDADIIVVNHSLLCSDLDAGGSLLPDYDYLVVDEAHHFEDAATKTFGVDLDEAAFLLPLKLVRNHLEDLTRRFEGTLFMNSSVLQSVQPLIDESDPIKQAVDNVFSLIALFVNRNVPDSGYVENLLVDRTVLGMEEWMNLGYSAEELAKDFFRWLKDLKGFAANLSMTDGQDFPDQETFTEELLQEIEILENQATHLKNFFSAEAESHVIRWMTSEHTGKVALHMAPLVAGEILKDKLYDEKKSIILTSATLAITLKSNDWDESADQKPFTYIRRMLNLDERFEELRLDSPYNFETQSYVMLPTDVLPLVATKSQEQLTDFFKDLITAVKGNMLGLFTSYRAIENLYLNLMEPLQNAGTTLLAQGISGGRNKLLKAYMNDPARSVLFGTNSFWEGIDIRGEALTTLVIHKLPFDQPNDPIVKARGELFENAFYQFQVPRAVLRFRQGFGRLIRSTTDYGVLIVLDDRLLKKDYGQMFLNALPNVMMEKMPIADIPAKVEEWLSLSGDRND